MVYHNGKAVTRMNVYQNKWAGNETYFVRIHTSGDKMYGIGIYRHNDKWYIDWSTSYYTHGLKEHPERWPVVGKIKESDFINLILTSIEQRNNNENT